MQWLGVEAAGSPGAVRGQLASWTGGRCASLVALGMMGGGGGIGAMGFVPYVHCWSKVCIRQTLRLAHVGQNINIHDQHTLLISATLMLMGYLHNDDIDEEEEEEDDDDCNVTINYYLC